MDTLHAPGARTPFGHGAGGRVWQGRRQRKERDARTKRSVAVITPKFESGFMLMAITQEGQEDGHAKRDPGVAGKVW